jgi:hypothetical protein
MYGFRVMLELGPTDCDVITIHIRAIEPQEEEAVFHHVRGLKVHRKFYIVEGSIGRGIRLE